MIIWLAFSQNYPAISQITVASNWSVHDCFVLFCPVITSKKRMIPNHVIWGHTELGSYHEALQWTQWHTAPPINTFFQLVFSETILHGADFSLVKDSKNWNLEDYSCTPILLLIHTRWLPIQPLVAQQNESVPGIRFSCCIFCLEAHAYVLVALYLCILNHSLKVRSVIFK